MLRALIGVLLLAVAASAQESRASLTGVITDSTQAAIAGAAVKLTNSNTGVAFDTTSNSVGEYRFLFLNPGTYQIKVEMAGFRALEQTGIVLQVGQSAAVNLSLQLVAISETVTVSSTAAPLETEKSDRGVVVDKRRITDLPLNVRNPIMLTALSPGITHTGGQAHLNPFSNSGISSWSVNGGLNNNTEFIMDGAPNNAFSGRQNRIAYVPPADAVEEFKVMTTVYDAQYGRTGGGVINVSSKSGTNSYHGSAYEFLKRPGLNANPSRTTPRDFRDSAPDWTSGASPSAERCGCPGTTAATRPFSSSPARPITRACTFRMNPSPRCRRWPRRRGTSREPSTTPAA